MLITVYDEYVSNRRAVVLQSQLRRYPRKIRPDELYMDAANHKLRQNCAQLWSLCTCDEERLRGS